MRERRRDRERRPEERPGEWSPWKLFFRVLLFWALAVGAAFLCSYVQFEDIVDTGKSAGGSSFLSGKLYRLNIANYIIGGILFVLVFTVLWYTFMRRPLRHIRRSPVQCIVACCIVTLAGVCGILYAAVMADMMHAGIFSKIEQEYLEALTLFGWPIFALIFTIAALIPAWRRAGRPPMPPKPEKAPVPPMPPKPEK